MALTKEIIKLWPTLTEGGLFVVGVEVVLKEDEVEVRRKSFTYNATRTDDVSPLSDILLPQAQLWIDTYKQEKTAYNHAKYETLRASIDSGLVL